MFGSTAQSHCLRQPTGYEFQYISSSIGVNQAELRRVYNEYMSATIHNNGLMDRREFRRWYIKNLATCRRPLGNRRAKRMANLLFKSFDSNNTGSLSFNEFMAGLVVLRGRGSPRERLQFAIQSTSTDGTLPQALQLSDTQTLLRGLDVYYKSNNADSVYNQLQVSAAGQQAISTSHLLDILDGSPYARSMADEADVSSSSDLSD